MIYQITEAIYLCAVFIPQSLHINHSLQRRVRQSQIFTNAQIKLEMLIMRVNVIRHFQRFVYKQTQHDGCASKVSIFHLCACFFVWFFIHATTASAIHSLLFWLEKITLVSANIYIFQTHLKTSGFRGFRKPSNSNLGNLDLHKSYMSYRATVSFQ